jgi:mannose-6-phosphate isomerase class I
MSTVSTVFKISPGIQDYAWGKKGGASLAAQFAKVSVPGFEIQDKPYAEVCPPVLPPDHTSAPSYNFVKI